MTLLTLVMPYSADLAFQAEAVRRRQDIEIAAEPLIALMQESGELLCELGYAGRAYRLTQAARVFMEQLLNLQRLPGE